MYASILLVAVGSALAVNQRSNVPPSEHLKNLGIVGGHGAGRFWRFMASIYYKHAFVCGGSIIGEEWILTAAQCIYGRKKKDMKVGVDVHITAEPKQTFNVSELYLHPNYNPKNRSFDFGLIKTNKSITFSKIVRPIRLGYGVDLRGTELSFAGNGADERFGKFSPYMKYAQMDYLPQTLCEKRYYVKKFKALDSTKFCADGREAFLCKGDFGSPAVIEMNGGTYQVGVASRSFYCSHNPAIFSNVTQACDFVRNTTDGSVSCSR